MKRWFAVATFAVAAISLGAVRSFAQSFTLDSTSAGLGAATPADILTPPAGIGPGPLPPPVVGLSGADLGLLPGDVIDSLSFGDDGGSTMYFSVDRASVGAGPPAVPPGVTTEVTGVPPGFQGQAAGDLFSAFDPSCPPTSHTQAVDGDGVPIGPLGCYGGFGLGLMEVKPTPPPPFVDNINAFDWDAPGRWALGCVFFTLTPGSPTLMGSNPLLPGGAETQDILTSCSGPPFFFGVRFPATDMGVVRGPIGCGPPVCDAIDALDLSDVGGFNSVRFSLAPGSPTLTTYGRSAADIFGGSIGFLGSPPPVVAGFAALGLAAGDNVDGLDSVGNPCPVAVGTGPDAADKDGVGACDNCPGVFNPDQNDSDGDTIGDACDSCTDWPPDGDGFGSPGFPANVCPTDLCPFTPGPNGDADADGVGDICDNCPAVANADQANVDVDVDGDACDPCPHASGALPAPFDAGTLKKAQLGYKNNGPGSGDDSVKTGASFTTATAFDPDTTAAVYLTLTNTGSSATISSTTMQFGWTQSNPAKLAWKYSSSGPPTVKASIKESPAASGTYKWKVGVKNTSLPGPQIAPATDDIQVLLEIDSPANVCFSGVLPTCTSDALKKDSCTP